MRLESSGHHSLGLHESDIALLPVPGAIICLDAGVGASDSGNPRKVYGRIEWIHLQPGTTSLVKDTLEDDPSGNAFVGSTSAGCAVASVEILQGEVHWGHYQLTSLTPADLHR